MTDWYSVEDQQRLVAAWSDAPVENEELCAMLLNTAREQVIAYAPKPADDAAPEPSERLVYAQLQQATNLWNASRAIPDGGDIGDGAYSFTPRPLDKTIQTIIRPIDRRPDVY